MVVLRLLFLFVAGPARILSFRSGTVHCRSHIHSYVFLWGWSLLFINLPPSYHDPVTDFEGPVSFPAIHSRFEL